MPPHGKSNTQQIQDMNESILNHLFLPLNLPSSADSDFCLRSNHRNEHILLECFNDYFNIYDSINAPFLRPIVDCSQRWSVLQRNPNLSIDSLQTAIESLQPGAFLPIYIHAQNAAILIEIDENHIDQPLISSWQVLLPIETINSSIPSNIACFPVQTYQLPSRSCLTSTVHCELLVDLMKHTIEYRKIDRNGREIFDTKDVPFSHYVYQWWIQHFPDIQLQSNCDKQIRFQKKHRDQIRSNNHRSAPFRRSSLWMTIKTVFQTILTKHYGQIGTVVYKLLITHFLTWILHTKRTSIISTDLLVHCIRKVQRRLNKLDHFILTIDSNEINQWIQSTKDDIQKKIHDILPNNAWQQTMKNNDNKSIHNFDFNNPEFYRHTCTELKKYLNNKIPIKSSRTIHKHEQNTNDDDPLSFESNHPTGNNLTDSEIRILSWLDQWLEQPLTAQRETYRYEKLLRFYNEYQKYALNHYCSRQTSTDSNGYSRFLLVSLMIIRVMHEKLCYDQRFERLKEHRIAITNFMDLFEYFLCSTRDEMQRIRQLYDYFHRYENQSYPDLLDDIDSDESFGVVFAKQSTKINSCLRKIQNQHEKDRTAKIQEVRSAKEKYNRLMTTISGLECSCTDDRLCKRCQLEQQANKIDVDIYESPIPSKPASALAVMFELRMPIEIRCYRDILWLFNNRSRFQHEHDRRFYEWLNIQPHSRTLEPHYTGPKDCKVKLVSSTNSISKSGFTNPPIATASVEDFLYDNSLDVKLTPYRSPLFETECQMLTPQIIDVDYKRLQYAIQSTEFVQNRVLADVVHIPSTLKSKQFIEFGSFRSGHRLQWWNLLSLLEIESLSLNDETIALLIHHAIFQYGPITEQNSSWCSEAHEILLNDHFVDELIARLHRQLDACANNWQNELTLVVISTIAMRLLNVCQSTREKQLIDLMLKCRSIGEKWIDMISKYHIDQMENLRLNLLTIAHACLLTCSNRVLLSTDQHMVSLLKAITTIYENRIANEQISVFRQDLLRFSERILVQLQSYIDEFLRKSSFSSLNQFIAIYWKTDMNSIDCQWTKLSSNIYEGQYESSSISIDCLQGIVLINDTNIANLPKKILTNEIYIRLFGDYIFQVQIGERSNVYVSKHLFGDDEQIRYEFEFDERLIIREKHLKTNDMFELISWKCFENDLPMKFTSEFSHWKNTRNQIIEFRSAHFHDANFWTYKPFIFNIETGLLTTNDDSQSQILIKQSSTLFECWFLKYFICLDEKPHVYMLKQNDHIHIHLSRLSIAFTYQITNQCFVSREYADMCIDENQWLGTLTGLRSGLLLSPIESVRYQFRKLIIPFGYIFTTWDAKIDHQIVSIQRKASMSYANQYFLFILNDRLRSIQPTDCPTGWLYLALLHALTSHPLPDEYTGMTGMERAFQLLNSAACSTDQPFDSLSYAILQQLAAITPKVTHSYSIANIEWSDSKLPYSMQHWGYYLIVKQLIEISEKFKFMFHQSNETLELNDERLVTKFYFDYRSSYNPMARLSIELENELLNTMPKVSPYQPIVEHHSSTFEKRPVTDLYRQGDLRLKDLAELKIFPLSQWLTDEYKLNIVWIGLLKLADSLKTNSQTIEIERFLLLIDFLHFISAKQGIQLVYLQILKTVLQTPNLLINTIHYPPFTQYHNIQHTTAVMNAIDFNSHRSAGQRRTIFEEVKKCFEINQMYKDQCRLATNEEKNQIKFLLKSWELNKKLHTYLINLQNLLTSFEFIQLNNRISTNVQRFQQKTIDEQYEIKLQPNDKQINDELLQLAERRYRHSNSDYFLRPMTTKTIVNQYRDCPDEIFSSIDDFREIGCFFQTQLENSWKQLQSIESYQYEYPSKDEIIQYLKTCTDESARLWKELFDSIVTNNEQLFSIGLAQRLTPTNLISHFHSIWSKKIDRQLSFLSNEQCTLLGGLMVNWVVEQQIERALHLITNNKHDEFKHELSNIPHTNWIPSDYLPWLILELEMNLTIRPIQVDVAQHMMQRKNLVMQLNMGEGKTSVIIPMLALSLCSSSTSLVRIIVLKSLFPTNYQSLKLKLGGLLNRRLFPFVCRRDMNFTIEQIHMISQRFQQGLHRCDIVLVSPEDILSFDLLTIDKCRRQDFETSRSMLTVQRWLKTYARDILDESDEILHYKYQLIYTIGRQQQIDGGEERWKFIQLILNLVKRFANEIAEHDPVNVFYKLSDRPSAFPEFRFLSHESYPILCEKLVDYWLNQRSYRKFDRERILSLIFDLKSTIESFVDEFPPNDIQMFLLIRGLLTSDVLYNALIKRYRVNYGINSNPNFHRLMAVPFRAKDVAADRTEFGHPDTALILTQLAYYYSGLSDAQMLQCFDRLSQEERDPESIYTEWISQEDERDVPQHIRQWKSVNFKDCKQDFRLIFDLLHTNMLVIDYFLNSFVFPREAKQFPHKLISSAWDLSSSNRTNSITGFSGTNDTQLLLPVHIQQCDLNQLAKTDAIVINNLLQPINENYRYLPVDSTSQQLLSEIVKLKSRINVILDVGALFIDGKNHEIAMTWLKLSDRTQIDYVIYFENDFLVVCDRQFRLHSFSTSPANERLDRCLIYLDEVHTRGTDFKFPNHFQAVVTLGNGLTKDRFVQACMRMRRLGQSHSLIFWSSHEVHQQICSLTSNAQIQLKDILRWVYKNTQRAIWNGLHHWAMQSLSFQRKMNAFEKIQWTNVEQIFTDELMIELVEKCLETEIIELKRLYGVPKVWATTSEIYMARQEHSNGFLCEKDIHQAVEERLKQFSGSKQRLAQLFDEEQQREIEQELEQEEEREQEHEQRPIRSIVPWKSILHDEIKRLCNHEEEELNLNDYPLVFRPLAYAFTGSTLSNLCQNENWQENFWISTEFQRVIEANDQLLDPFLRPARWIVVYRNRQIIFVNPYEANWLMGELNQRSSSTTTLRLFLPRLKRNQSIFVNTSTLISIPQPFILPIEWLVQLFVFNGTIYFDNVEEQTAYCQYLALCLKPRTVVEENAFENGWIDADGYVQEVDHRRQLNLVQARFNRNPFLFLKELLKNRNNTYPSTTSHMGSIIYNCFKPFSRD